MKLYNKGARFERQIIHALTDMGALLVMRGSGSKSYGSIKADIIALFPSGYLLIIQAKNSANRFRREREGFNNHPQIPNIKIIWLWATPESYKEDLREIAEVIK
jgi:hypothetical protein